MNIYKVCIIGCGSIGALKPEEIDGPDTTNILTHAHAVSQHPRSEIFAMVDSDEEKLREGTQKWKPQRAFRSIIGELENEPAKPDIVIVATPTDTHYQVLKDLTYLKPYMPKLIIVEKPFCPDLNYAKETIQDIKLYSDAPIMVDYIRRFSPGHQKIKAMIESSSLGKALNCRVLYTKGLFHEGCHAIDLMRYFFGECIETEYALGMGEGYGIEIEDRDLKDPTIPLQLIFDKCSSVIFQPCDGRKYGIFEVDMCFEEGRIRLIDNGLFYERYPVNEKNEWGHKSLSYKLTEVIRQETGLNIALYNLIDNAVNFLDGKADLLCTADDALAVHEVLRGLKW